MLHSMIWSICLLKKRAVCWLRICWMRKYTRSRTCWESCNLSQRLLILMAASFVICGDKWTWSEQHAFYLITLWCIKKDYSPCWRTHLFLSLRMFHLLLLDSVLLDCNKNTKRKIPLKHPADSHTRVTKSGRNINLAKADWRGGNFDLISLTGDLNELLSTSTFLLSVHALLGDLISSLSAGNTINKEEVQSLIVYSENCKAKEALHI